VIYDGEIIPQPEEVDSVHPMTIEEIFRRNEEGEKFTPDGIFACQEYRRHKESK